MISEQALQMWETASYMVTALGLPYALGLFMYESYKERRNDDEEIYQELAGEYARFAQLLIENADLRLMTGHVPDEELTAEQAERKKIIFDLLIALFERAYILVYEEKMDRQTRRLWATWEDYIRFWCQRTDFRKALPGLLVGEDPDFCAYILKTAQAA